MNKVQELIGKLIFGPNFIKQMNLKRKLPFVPDWMNGQPIWKAWNTENAIVEGLKASVWVFRCVKILADNAASVPWIVEEKKGDDWVRVQDHPIELLLRKPNPFMSGQDLFQYLTYHLNLGGNGIWKYISVGNNKTPVEIWPIMPWQITPVPEAKTFIGHYEFKVTQGSQPIPIPPEEIAHFMFVDPSNFFWGLAPLQPASKAVDTDTDAARWNKVALQNRAVPDGVFTFEAPLTKDQWMEAKEQVTEQHQGSNNARTPWILGAGSKWESMSMTPAEMDFLEGRKFTMYEIHAAFGVDPLLTGAPDYAGRANKKEARIGFWEETEIPYLDDLKSSLNLSLIKFWDPESARVGTAPKLRINYDLSNVSALKELIYEKSKTALLFSKIGIPSNMINQRLELGFPSDIPNGDIPLVTPKQQGAPVGQAGQAALPMDIGSKDISSETKDMLWKKVDSARVSWENRIVKDIAKRFEMEKMFVSRAYLKTGKVDSAVNNQTSAWEKMLTAIYIAEIEFFVNRELRNISRQKSYEFKQFGADEETRKFIKDTIAKHVTEISDTSKKRLNRVIADGIESDKLNTEIAKDIRDKYDHWAEGEETDITRSRSMTISRTETGTASGFGIHHSAEVAEDEFNIKIGKIWVDSGDDEVRDTHQNVNGGRAIPLDKDFDNGLAYPNDAGGPSEEVVNCRCVEVHEVLR